MKRLLHQMKRKTEEDGLSIIRLCRQSRILSTHLSVIYLDETLTEKADAEPGESAYLFNGTKCTVNGTSIVLYGSYSAIEMEDGSFRKR